MVGDLRFDTDTQRPDEFAWTRNSRGKQFELTDWLVKKGIGKDIKQAEYILVGVCIFCVVVAFIFFSSQGRRAKPPERSIDGTLIR